MALDYTNHKLVVESNKIEAGSVSWRSPSNLAIIKYWGKHGRQLPRNPSISFTLDEAYTETTLSYEPKKGVDQGIDLTFLFNGLPNEAFAKKVKTFLESIVDIFPFLRQLKWTINSSNSFPHSSGIASSASSMSALALCLCTLEDNLFDTLKDDNAFRQKASYIARLGSGSACRSIFAGLSMWGEMGEVENSSDFYAIPVEDKVHDIFKTYHDAILIVNQGEKSVSSRAGHALMEGNPYADKRYQQARQRLHNLLLALQNGDVEAVGNILEAEALTLHALMMASNPPYILIKPNTLTLIDKVKSYRKDTGHPLYFSLDAGPNLHLLYPDNIKNEVDNFIETELSSYCEDKHWIADKIGKGPLQL
ncbi:MAG: diphosphomevalonate decarboxylase [Chitinophagales bacterium]|nr:diphosphomevalonate decarboxylase [Chitinophagales bacterium]